MAIQHIRKSFHHALHLVTVHLHRHNQVAHALRTRDFWLAKHFPTHFAQRVHEYPVTLSGRGLVIYTVHKMVERLEMNVGVLGLRTAGRMTVQGNIYHTYLASGGRLSYSPSVEQHTK